MSTPERPSHSWTMMVRGSPLGERSNSLLKHNTQRTVNNICSRTTAKKTTKNIQSTVHNITQKFRESGEITAAKGQGWKPGMNARDLQSLRTKPLPVDVRTESLHLQMWVLKTPPCKAEVTYQKHPEALQAGALVRRKRKCESVKCESPPKFSGKSGCRVLHINA